MKRGRRDLRTRGCAHARASASARAGSPRAAGARQTPRLVEFHTRVLTLEGKGAGWTLAPIGDHIHEVTGSPLPRAQSIVAAETPRDLASGVGKAARDAGRDEADALLAARSAVHKERLA